MGYLGYKPADKPLTAADITDSIITSAKIVDGTIVNADISSTAGITLNKLSGNPNFRNIVINGDMQVAQRNTSVASITTANYYTLDRWYFYLTTLGTWTMSQSTDVPSGYGFANSLKLDCTTADASPAAGDLAYIATRFEGQNLQYLKKGTASAVSLTASFWVKSTKTGTFIITIYDTDNNRNISKSYTVNTTNTWEFKTVTFAGDATGTLGNDNGDSLAMWFWIGAGTNFTSGTLATSWASFSNANSAVGQVNCADNTANDFLITGIQLEAGTSATDFESLPIDVSLGRCERYYQTLQYVNAGSITIGHAYGTGDAIADINFKKMRVAPTVTLPTAGTGTGQITYLNSSANVPVTIGTLSASSISVNNFRLNGTSYTSAFTAGNASILLSYGSNAIKMESEL
jgi:hypothetical protein